jgi:hypothetical protein
MTEVAVEQGRLLRGEAIFEEIEIIELSEAEQKEEHPYRLLKLRGTASRGGVVNRNNRMYPTSVLNKAVEKAQSKIRRGKFVGELDHPEWGSGSLSGIAIKYTKLWMEGDYMRFEADVLPTEKGRQLETLLRSGIKPGISTRGYGSVDAREINGRRVLVVKDDYELAGIDAVLEESNQYAGISSFESKGGLEMELTVEKLRKDYPDLVKAIEDEVREAVKTEESKTIRADLEKEFEQKVASALEAKKESWMEEARKSVMESDEVKQMKTIVDAVLEAVKPVLPAQTKEDLDAVLKAENETLKSEVQKKDEKVNQLEQENKDLKAKVEERETRDKVLAKVEEKVKGHRFESILRERLAECKTEEDVEKKFESEVKFIEKLVESKDVPKGTGEQDEGKDDKPTLDEVRQRQRALAGIKEEGGSK